MESTYKILMMISAVVLILLSVILATNKLPKTPRFRKVRMTQVLLIIAFSSLGIMNILCFIKGYHPEIESFITLIISLYQAFLLSSTITVLIRLDYIRWKYLLTNLAVITAIVASMGILYFFFPKYYQWAFWIFAAIYFEQMVLYSTTFLFAYHATVRDADSYYADNNDMRLRRIRICFDLMLVVGISAFITIFTDIIGYLIFVPCYIVCYSTVTGLFVHYIRKTAYILPAIEQTKITKEQETMNPPQPSYYLPSSVSIEALRHEISAWTENKLYLRKDIPYSTIIQKLNTDIPTLRWFMKKEFGMDFRSWRNQLRLKEACNILEKHPEMNIDEVREIVGYNDASNFSKDFKKLTGLRISEYKKAAATE